MTTKTIIHLVCDDYDEGPRLIDTRTLMWSIDDAIAKGWLGFRPEPYEGVVMPHAIYINLSKVSEMAFVTTPG